MRQADRIILNTLSNYALTFVTMATQLVMVPVVLHQLQKSGFGLANMVLAPFGFFEVLTASFGRALHRYIPHDLAENDVQQASRTFSTAMAGYLVMGLVGSLAVFILFNWLLAGADVSPERMADGRVAMWILVAWLVVGFPLWGYRKGLEAIQRYDLLGVSHGIVTLIRTLVVIIVFWMGKGSIAFYVGSHLVALIFVNLLCRRALLRAVPGLRESLRLIDRKTVLLVGTFAAASLFGMVGEICGSFGFRIFVGKELGMDSLGVLAALWTLQLTMARLIDELTNAFAPAISALDASGAKENVAKLMLMGTKSSVLVASSMAVVPLAAAAPFLRLWLGEGFREHTTLMYVLLLILLVYCLGLTPTHVLYGLGRVRVTGTVMLLRGVAGLLLSFIYVHFIGRNLTIATSCMFGMQCFGGLVMFVFAGRAVGLRWGVATLEVWVKPLVLACIGAVATWFVLREIGDNRMWKLGIGVTGGEIVLLGLVLLFGLREEERDRIFSFFTRAWGGFSQEPAE